MSAAKREPPVAVDATAHAELPDVMSTLVSLHTRADAFQLVEFNKALHKTTPGGKLARFFARAEKTPVPSVTLEQMLKHQLEPLPAPLLRACGAELHTKAIKAFSLVLRYSEDRSLTVPEALEAAQKLLQMGLRHTDMRDELYMQLLKQTRGNSDVESRQQLWELFNVIAASMPPSKEYVSLLSHYIHEVAHDDDEERDVKMKAARTWHALKRSVRSGARKWLPSIQEIEAMLADEKLKTVIYFLDETCEEVEYGLATTVLEAVEQLAQLIHLEHYHSFSLFESRSSGEAGEESVLLDDQSYLSDVLNDLGRNPESIGRLIFKKRMFRESDQHITETQFLNLTYIQTQYDYLLGYYPVVYEDAAQLCALQLFSEFGAQLPGDDKLLKKALERFTLRDVKRMRTREEWKADVILRCTTLKCPSAEMARYAFLSVLRSLPYGHSVFFHVRRLDDPIGLLPPKLVLGINHRGVHFFRPIPKEYLHSVELRDIMQFGSSHRAVFFKMRVAAVLHIFQFETSQGEDICMAIQTHINDIMVRRYATMPEIPLHPQERSIRVQLEEKMEQKRLEWQKDVDTAIHKQDELVQLQGDHIRERDRQRATLHDTRRHMSYLQKEKLEISQQLETLQEELQQLQGKLVATERPRHVGVTHLVRLFDDTSVEELGTHRQTERQLKLQLSQIKQEKQFLREAITELRHSPSAEIQKWEEALIDAQSEGQSRIELQEGRIGALRDEICAMQSAVSDTQEQLNASKAHQEELQELKVLKVAVEERDAVQAATIESQKQRLHSLEHLYKREQLSRKKLYNRIEDKKGKIRVYARLRPHPGQRYALHQPDEVTVSHVWKKEESEREYSFDGVFGPGVTQQEVFQDTQDLIQSAVDGYNVCLFAYGQTGSGKTFTIYGTPEQPGLTPRAIDALFHLLSQNARKMKFRVSCTMLELYQDTLRDLLLSKHPHPEFRVPQRLEIKKDRHQLVRVQGATCLEVGSAEECIAAFEEGQRRRHVAETQLNIASSRSHLIMSVMIESTDLQTQTQTRGKLSFVDLAGSERIKKSKSTGEQLKEAQAINKSLSALGDVISSLARGDPYIPYRNHKLTMLMSDSLGGNAKTLMFVNVSPTEANLDETQNSLQYAMRVRTIKNSAQRGTNHEEQSWKARMAFWKSMGMEEHRLEVQKMLEAFH